MGTSPMPRPSRAAPQRRPGRSKPASLTLFPTAARSGNGEPESVGSEPPPAAGPSNKLATELVGIARLAAFSPRAEAKRGIEYYLLPVRSILNHCHSERVPFRWTANPYRGCEFGCRYCYARYTHEFMELGPETFEDRIYAKANVAALLRRELRKKDRRDGIAIGTATDPYQPAERR